MAAKTAWVDAQVRAAPKNRKMAEGWRSSTIEALRKEERVTGWQLIAAAQSMFEKKGGFLPEYKELKAAFFDAELRMTALRGHYKAAKKVLEGDRRKFAEPDNVVPFTGTAG